MVTVNLLAVYTRSANITMSAQDKKRSPDHAFPFPTARRVVALSKGLGIRKEEEGDTDTGDGSWLASVALSRTSSPGEQISERPSLSVACGDPTLGPLARRPIATGVANCARDTGWTILKIASVRGSVPVAYARTR